jgi:hypothetical protein
MRKLPSAAVSQTTSGRANAIGRSGDFLKASCAASGDEFIARYPETE